MKRIFFWLLICFLSWNVFSETNDDTRRVEEFLGAEGKGWKLHFTDRGTVRSAYGNASVPANSSDEAATRFLNNYHDLFGVDHLEDLRLERIEQSELGGHYFYRQYFSGYRVLGSGVVIHISPERKVFAITSDFHPDLKAGNTTVFSKEYAMETARVFMGNGSHLSSAGLVVLPMGNKAMLTWQIEADPEDLTEGSRIFYIDASNPRVVLKTSRTYATFEGEGEIFAENPVVTPQTGSLPFHHMDASTSLSGLFAKIYNANFSQPVIISTLDLSKFTTASDPNRRYDYNQTDARFTEAMAYFHINTVHDHWKSLGFKKLNRRFPVFVNVVRRDGSGFDNAFYTRSQKFRTGIIVTGSGDKFENFGLDADVYYHEFGHAVLDQAKPGFFDSTENNYSFAFHEAFGDISASAITGNSKLGEFALRLKESHRFHGRNLDNHNRFPRNVILPSFGLSEPHYTGLIFGGAWWDLQKSIGAEPAQRLLYKCLPILPNEMTFFDVRDAMLTTDEKLNHGSGNKAIQAAFALHGLSGADPGQPGTFTITALKTARRNQKGRFAFQKTFKKGEWIYVTANYTAANLTPGYNLIPVTLQMETPKGSDAFTFAWIDEISNGVHVRSAGVIQAIIGTTAQTIPGSYSVTIASRLGGSSRTSAPKTIRFQLR